MQDMVERIRMIGRSGRLGPDDFKVKLNGDPTNDLVLQNEQVIGGVIEPLGP